jgi:pSer/pThr/pTyr-binding forkhead associated (FHA) protein
VITCPKCGKENQDHYKFCLGCGSELPRDVASPARGTFSTPTPPAGIPVAPPAPDHLSPAAGAPPFANLPPPPIFTDKPDLRATTPSADMFAPPPAPAFQPPAAAPSRSRPAPPVDEAEPTLAPMGAMVSCPNCGTPNPANVKFCGACGARLEAKAPAPAFQPPPALGREPAASLVLIRPDGSEGGNFALGDGATTVGRSAGQLFGADAYLSPQHATFVFTGGRMVVRDEGSLNGIYVRIPAEKPFQISPGDVVRMGQELVRVETIPESQPDAEGTELMGSAADDVWGRVSLIVGEGQIANSFCLSGDGVVLGRERGDVLFPEDGYVSGTHVRIQRQGGQMMITDLNSSNGTFLRVATEHELNRGDYILMGQQLFRVDF